MSSYFELGTVNMLQDGLSGAMVRQSAIADNMANANTPGYKRKEVSFQQSLKQAYVDEGPGLKLQTAHPRHLSNRSSRPVDATAHEVTDTNMRNDGNNVDPDREMAKQAKNSMYYNGLAQFEKKAFGQLKSLISNLRRP